MTNNKPKKLSFDRQENIFRMDNCLLETKIEILIAYFNETKTSKELAEQHNCHTNTINNCIIKWSKDHNIMFQVRIKRNKEQ